MEQPRAITGAEHTGERLAHRNLNSRWAPTAGHEGNGTAPTPRPRPQHPQGSRVGTAAPRGLAVLPQSRLPPAVCAGRREGGEKPHDSRRLCTGVKPAAGCQQRRGTKVWQLGAPILCLTPTPRRSGTRLAPGHQNRGATEQWPRGAELERTGTILGLPAPSLPRHRAPGMPQQGGSGGFGGCEDRARVTHAETLVKGSGAGSRRLARTPQAAAPRGLRARLSPRGL